MPTMLHVWLALVLGALMHASFAVGTKPEVLALLRLHLAETGQENFIEDNPFTSG